MFRNEPEKTKDFFDRKDSNDSELNRKMWVALNFTEGIGPKMFHSLLDRFGSPAKVFEASTKALTSVHGIGDKTARKIKKTDPFTVIDDILSQMDEDTSIITIAEEDDQYPENLRSISDAPPVMFIKGSIEKHDNRSVAIVGSRNCSDRGKNIAFNLGKEFSERGWTVVSGFAKGIDTSGHVGALEGGGRTLAVFGSGINIVHPSKNRNLVEQVIKRGAILSELSPNVPPRGTHLMARDRIISGLSCGVIVVEASENSGTMDTAERAQKQERKIFTVDLDRAGNQTLLNDKQTHPISPVSPDVDQICSILNRSLAQQSKPDSKQPSLLKFD